MTIAFERPIGAHSDLNELKYISALHQTAVRSLRSNGSIQAEDIVNFLFSRHGIKVDKDNIIDNVLVDLTGDLENDPNKILDLCSLVSLLLIPHLAKVATSGKSKQINALFGKVLDTIKTEVFGAGKSDGVLKLNSDMLRRILDRYGEVNMPDDIIEEMLIAAGGPIHMNGTLDVDTFMHALTGDVTKYGLDWDTTITTHYQDVFEPLEETEDTAFRLDKIDEDVSSTDSKEETSIMEGVFTASFVDTTADTFRSQAFSVILWVALLDAYVCYFFGSGLTSINMKCDANFGCHVLEAIVTWVLVFLQLSTLGSTFIILGSIGNSLREQKFASIRWHVGGMVAVFCMTIIPVVFKNPSPKLEYLRTAYWILLLLGAILLLLQFLQLMDEHFDLSDLKQYAWLDIFFTPGIMRAESKTKKAATHKVSLLVDNSLALHESSTSKSHTKIESTSRDGLGLINFQLQEGLREKVGGFMWVWTKIVNGTLFTEEGVYLHSRVVASNAAQFLVTAFIFTMCGFGIKRATTVKSFTLQVLTGIQEPGTFQPQTEEVTLVYDWEIAVGATVGLVAGCLASLFITLIFLPSFISSVLRFRSGVIPSLQAKDFLNYRFAIDQITMVFGSAFWGCIYSAIIMTLVVGGIVFLAVWHISRPYVLGVIANIFGMIVTVVLKIILLQFLRHQFYAAFYRKRAAAANFMNVAMECWNLGLSAGFMLVRALRLAFVTFIYLGRIDTPFLAPGIGVFGPITLDAYPVAFCKDLLVHEAHRHPYLERLGTMYMMKLRFGKEFANRAGSCWRILFVLALMPWLSKYRIRNFLDDFSLEIDDAHAKLVGDEPEVQDDLAELWYKPSKRNLKHENSVQRLENMRALRNTSIMSHEELIECIAINEIEEDLELTYEDA